MTAAALLQKLRDANDGITLTRKERLVLLSMLPQPRKYYPIPTIRDKNIATLFWLYKANGLRTKAAWVNINRFYGVSRETILGARRRHLMDLSGLSPEMRAVLIICYETGAGRLDWMKEAYRLNREGGAAGIYDVLVNEYAAIMEAVNLLNLLDHIKSLPRPPAGADFSSGFIDVFGVMTTPDGS